VKSIYMSTDHLPKPRTATNFSISSSSLAPTSVSAVSSPETNFPASPCMYSALRWERPAVRSVGMSRSRTWVGFGNEGCVVGKRAVNLERMEEAAWPETCLWGKRRGKRRQIFVSFGFKRGLPSCGKCMSVFMPRNKS